MREKRAQAHSDHRYTSRPGNPPGVAIRAALGAPRGSAMDAPASGVVVEGHGFSLLMSVPFAHINRLAMRHSAVAVAVYSRRWEP
jgi:hypothetical protein